MKYNLPSIIGTECKNSDINHVWVLDADNSDYFNWNDSSLPKIHKIKDSQRIAIAAAADGLLNGYAGICVFPSASAVLESFEALHEINRNRIPLFVICFTDEYDLLSESIFYPLVRGCDFFVRSVNDQERVDFRIANSLQYAIVQKRVSILLINRKLSIDNKYEKCWRYKVHRTSPVTLPPDYAIRELAELINSVQKVSIICGEHCRGCVPELQALTERLKSPLTYIADIRNSIQGKVAYEVGIYGKWSEQSAMEAIQTSELILLLDYSEKDFRAFPVSPMIIQIIPYELNGLDAQKRKRIYRGDVKETLQQLLPLLDEKEDHSFADHLIERYHQDSEDIFRFPESQARFLSKLIPLLNDQIDHDTTVCSHGYNSYILKNFLLHVSHQRSVNLSYDLLSRGGILFEAVGLNGGNKKKPVIVFMDSDTLYNELSSLIPLTNLAYPIKLCIINSSSKGVRGALSPFSYQEASQSMQIPYFDLSDPLISERTINEWLTTEGGAILEIFGISFAADLLIETEEHVPPVFSESFEQSLYDSLKSLHAGKCFYYQDALSPDKFHLPLLKEFLVPLYASRSVFYAAVGAAHASKDIPVCIATSLSDILKMLPGIREARRTHTPILFLVILANDRDIFSRNDILILHKLVQIFSAYNYLADNPDKDVNLIIGEAIAEAQHLKSIGTIVFDPNLYQASRLLCAEIYDSPYVESEVYANDQELERVAKVINHSHQTVVFAGAGCKDAHREVMELVRKLKAPLGWTFRAKDEFDFDNYYPIGMAGLLSNPGLDDAFRKCEVLILLGTNLNFNNKVSKTCQIIQIDVNPITLGMPHPIDIGIVGNIKVTLKKLLPLLVTIGHNTFAEKCSKAYEEERENYEHMIRLKEKAQKGVLMESIFLDINKLAPVNAWVVADMVIPWYLTALNIQSKSDRKLFATGESVYTCNSTGFAVGALASSCQVPIIVLCTNITFFKQIDNLIKLVQSQQNIKVFIVHLWADTQKTTYSKLHLSSHMIGMSIDSHEELERKIAIALGMPGPVIVDIPVLRKELIKSPPFLPALVHKYNLILRKLYVNSEKEEMLQTFGRIDHTNTPE